MRFHPQDSDYDARVRASFARQAFMTTLGAQLVATEPGYVVIELPFRADLAQQHGFLHAGAATAVVDTACGYAALTLMPPTAAVLSVEFKVNLLAPGAGARFRAVGRVIRAGRTLTVCSGELIAVREGPDAKVDTGVVVALMQATMMAVREHAGRCDLSCACGTTKAISRVRGPAKTSARNRPASLRGLSARVGR